MTFPWNPVSFRYSLVRVCVCQRVSKFGKNLFLFALYLEVFFRKKILMKVVHSELRLVLLLEVMQMESCIYPLYIGFQPVPQILWWRCGSAMVRKGQAI